MPSLIDLMLEGRKIPQHARGRAPWSMLPSGHLQPTNWRRAAGACSASGVNLRRCTWRSSTAIRRRSRSSAWIAPIAFIPRSASTIRRRFDWSAPSTTCSDCRRKACRTPAPGSITTAGACASRWEIASTRCRRRRPTASCRRKAMACIRSRSAPCMRASSSPDISALPPAGRPWSGWNSGWDIPTRVSRG